MIKHFKNKEEDNKKMIENYVSYASSTSKPTCTASITTNCYTPPRPMCFNKITTDCVPAPIPNPVPVPVPVPAAENTGPNIGLIVGSVVGGVIFLAMVYRNRAFLFYSTKNAIKTSTPVVAVTHDAPGHTAPGHTAPGHTAPGHTAPAANHGHVAPGYTAPAVIHSNHVTPQVYRT